MWDWRSLDSAAQQVKIVCRQVEYEFQIDAQRNPVYMWPHTTTCCCGLSPAGSSASHSVIWSHMVWNTPLVSWDQLTLPNSLCTPSLVAARVQWGAQKALTLCKCWTKTFSALLSTQIQNAALCQLHWKNPTLSQSKPAHLESTALAQAAQRV